MGENSSGFTNEQSPQGGAFSRDLLDQKSKSPLFPGPGGAVVTNDWCINVLRSTIFQSCQDGATVCWILSGSTGSLKVSCKDSLMHQSFVTTAS